MTAQEIIEKIRAEVNRQAGSIDTATGDFAEGRRMEQRIILSVLSDLEKECEEKPTIKKQPVCDGLEEEHLNPFKFVAGCIDDTLKEKAKEVSANEIEDEINRWMGSTDCLPEDVGITPLPKAMEIVERTARHFYELGCRRTAEKYDEIEYKRQRADVCEGLEEASQLASEVCYPLENFSGSRRAYRKGFKDGAKWQKEQNENFEKFKEYTDNALISIEEAREQGRQEMKEQMMKEAVETELYWDGDFLAIDLNMAELGYSERDKVRIIIVKED